MRSYLLLPQVGYKAHTQMLAAHLPADGNVFADKVRACSCFHFLRFVANLAWWGGVSHRGAAAYRSSRASV